MTTSDQREVVSDIVKAIGDIQIAGSLTTDDWKKFRASVTLGDAGIWNQAFDDYFNGRLIPRYLKPIEVLQKNGRLRGEGFSIVAIQCSLIEFLESTVQGKSYRYRSRGAPPLEPYEYSNSSGIFVSFLVNRVPFNRDFDKVSALDFYIAVRCGLLHEARTKNGWTISAKQMGKHTIDAAKKIVYRDTFQKGLLEFINWYKSELSSNTGLQEAFIRKFDSLCD